jgi:hypothetical protein
MVQNLYWVTNTRTEASSPLTPQPRSNGRAHPQQPFVDSLGPHDWLTLVSQALRVHHYCWIEHSCSFQWNPIGPYYTIH